MEINLPKGYSKKTMCGAVVYIYVTKKVQKISFAKNLYRTNATRRNFVSLTAKKMDGNCGINGGLYSSNLQNGVLLVRRNGKLMSWNAKAPKFDQNDKTTKFYYDTLYYNIEHKKIGIQTVTNYVVPDEDRVAGWTYSIYKNFSTSINVDWAIAGVNRGIIRNGKKLSDIYVKNNNGAPNAITERTSLGVQSDGSIVLVVAVKADVCRLRDIMFDLKCIDAIMLDGGGSSQFYKNPNFKYEHSDPEREVVSGVFISS